MMIGFIFRLIVCGAIVLVPVYPVILVAPVVNGSLFGAGLLTVLVGAYLFVGMPMLWYRAYEWMEDHGKRE